MYRRNFLKRSLGGTVSLAVLQSRAFAASDEAPLRVGLIGCGWYGKNDLLHLMQVAPVEVVGLCDVDSQMLANAADVVGYTPCLPMSKSMSRSAVHKSYGLLFG
jgi:predicted homoserine dehydrogenase-like protein